MSQTQVFDEGVVIKVLVTDIDSGAVVDLSAVTTKQVWIKPLDADTLKKTASFFTDGTDGIITYTTIADDLYIDGRWKVQGYYVTAGGDKVHTTVGYFDVMPNTDTDEDEE